MFNTCKSGKIIFELLNRGATNKRSVLYHSRNGSIYFSLYAFVLCIQVNKRYFHCLLINFHWDKSYKKAMATLFGKFIVIDMNVMIKLSLIKNVSAHHCKLPDKFCRIACINTGFCNIFCYNRPCSNYHIIANFNRQYACIGAN